MSAVITETWYNPTETYTIEDNALIYFSPTWLATVGDPQLVGQRNERTAMVTWDGVTEPELIMFMPTIRYVDSQDVRIADGTTISIASVGSLVGNEFNLLCVIDSTETIRIFGMMLSLDFSPPFANYRGYWYCSSSVDTSTEWESLENGLSIGDLGNAQQWKVYMGICNLSPTAYYTYHANEIQIIYNWSYP